MFEGMPGWSRSHRAQGILLREPALAEDRSPRKTGPPSSQEQFLQAVSQRQPGPSVSSEAPAALTSQLAFLLQFVWPETRVVSRAYPDHTANQTATHSVPSPIPRPSSPHDSAV